jgi:hypothetical protein
MKMFPTEDRFIIRKCGFPYIISLDRSTFYNNDIYSTFSNNDVYSTCLNNEIYPTFLHNEVYSTFYNIDVIQHF